jgi:hypothetical protein
MHCPSVYAKTRPTLLCLHMFFTSDTDSPFDTSTLHKSIPAAESPSYL